MRLLIQSFRREQATAAGDTKTHKAARERRHCAGELRRRDADAEQLLMHEHDRLLLLLLL